MALAAAGTRAGNLGGAEGWATHLDHIRRSPTEVVASFLSEKLVVGWNSDAFTKNISQNLIWVTIKLAKPAFGSIGGVFYEIIRAYP